MRAGAVIVNFNGGGDLPVCLDALLAQTVPVEIVVVDCASSDGTRRLAEAPPLGVHGLPLPRNLGYAGGCAAGLALLAPEVNPVGFFNPDCFPARDFFAVCGRLLARERDVGGVAGRLMRADGVTLDSCGQLLTPFLLRVRDRGYDEPAAGAYETRADVLAACGAGMVYRREALAAAAVEGEVLPTEFFSFWEDLDLGWRVRNAGWRVVYEPEAMAVHRRAATAGPGTGRLILRRPPDVGAAIVANRWATLVRNLHAVDFLVRLPVLLPGEVLMVSWLILRSPRLLPALWCAVPRVRKAAHQRRAIPRKRLGRLQ